MYYESTYNEIANILTDMIPQEVAASDAPTPLCAVRIYYFDTHAPCTYVTLRTMSAACREKVVEKAGWNAPYWLWASSEETRDFDIDLPDPDAPRESHARLVELFDQVYRWMDEADEDHVILFQQSLQDVSRRLNSLDWSSSCPVTDDFIVAPADGSQYFGGNQDYLDLSNSIPDDRLDLLRERDFLGPSQREWSTLPHLR